MTPTSPTPLQTLLSQRQGQLSRRAAAREAHVSPDLLSDIAHNIPRACRISTLALLARWLHIAPLDMLTLYMEHYEQCLYLAQKEVQNTYASHNSPPQT